MSVFDTPEFRRLRGQYYLKLKRLGFQDIENEKEFLIDHRYQEDLADLVQWKPGLFDENRDYYLWAEQMVTLATFLSAQDRKIWAMHADGTSSHKIADKVKCSQTWASRRIRAIRKYLVVQDAILVMLTDLPDEP